MNIGKGIAFAALVLSATFLEINGKTANVLWFVIVLWVIFGSWNNKK